MNTKIGDSIWSRIRTRDGSPRAMTAIVNTATNQLSLGSYDANGNLYTIPGTNGGSPTYYAIDVENRMVSVNTSGSPSGVATYWYGYDPGNRRVWKGTYSSNGTLTAQEAYFYSPTGQKLGTYSLTLNNYPPSNDVAVATDIQVFFGAKRVGHSEPGNPTIIGGVTQDRVGSLGSYYPYGEDKGTPLPKRSMEVRHLHTRFRERAGLCDEPVLFERVG